MLQAMQASRVPIQVRQTGCGFEAAMICSCGVVAVAFGSYTLRTIILQIRVLDQLAV